MRGKNRAHARLTSKGAQLLAKRVGVAHESERSGETASAVAGGQDNEGALSQSASLKGRGALEVTLTVLLGKGESTRSKALFWRAGQGAKGQPGGP